MFNFQCNYRKSLLSFVLVPAIVTSGGISSVNLTNLQYISQSNQLLLAQNRPTFRISSLWQRRKRPNTVRSGPSNICAIAPGVVDTYIVWHDRPLFLWQSNQNQNVELIVRELETKKEVWKQPVNIADQKALYSAQESLEAGKAYEWKLTGTTNWRIFQVMSPQEHQKIATQLQAIDQKLKASIASPEEIAAQKAEYFLDYKVQHKTEPDTFNLWSDVLQSLYEVDKPSSSFIQERQELITNLCNAPTKNVGG
jgi:hypothetical protein